MKNHVRHPFFIFGTFAIAFISALLGWLRSSRIEDAFQDSLQNRARQLQTSFQLHFSCESKKAEALSFHIANDPEVGQMVAAASDALVREGGGKGGKLCATIRQELRGRMEKGWDTLRDSYGVTQIHFHLFPGGTSFYRVHNPDDFGDDLTETRHLPTAAWKGKKPVSGIETGRSVFGIRGASPVFAPTRPEPVGVVEAVSSFDQMLAETKRSLGVEFSIALKGDLLRQAMWKKDYAEVSRRGHLPSNLVIAATTSPLVEQLLSHSRNYETKSLEQAEIIRLDRVYSLSIFPLRDFRGTLDSRLDPIGFFVAHENITSRYTTMINELRVIILFHLLVFAVLETLLALTVWLAKNRFQQIIVSQTEELDRQRHELENEFSQRSQTTIALRDNEEMLRETQRLGKIGGWSYNPHDKSLTCSQLVREIMGLPQSGDISFEDALSRCHPVDRRIAIMALSKSVENGSEFDLAIQLEGADGRLLWARLIGSAIQEQGQTVKVAGAFQDITERKLFEAEMERARREAEIISQELSRTLLVSEELRENAEKAQEEAEEYAEQARQATIAKSEFLANMSHEIRTPMNGVIGMIDILSSTALARDQREFVNIAASSARNLLAVINDILDFSKIEAGKLSLEKICFDLAGEIESATQTFGLMAEDKGIDLLLRLPLDLPPRVTGDPVRIRQIVTNLVGNAIKFTSRGSVTVSLSAAVEGDHVAATLEVEDTGIGIPPESQSRIFESFTQADASTTRKYSGTGLGLSICKQLTDLMGGSIGLSSSPGAGSVFTVKIPLGLAESTPAEELAPLKTLLVCSNKTCRQNLRFCLEELSFPLSQAESGEEALAILADLPVGEIGLVVIDFPLADMDASGLATAIKSTVHAAHLHVLQLAAISARPEDMKSPAGAIVSKPVSVFSLARRIRKMLRVDSPRQAVEQQEQDRKLIPVLLAEDNPVNQEVGKIILGKLGCAVDIASNGRQAVEMAGNRDYRIIFMDCQMPEMDGFEATAKIREQGLAPIIIAMTAEAMHGTRERCLAAGMDDYVSKPIDRESISALLSRHRGACYEQKAPKPAATEAVFDAGQLAQATGGDNELSRQVLDIFLADLPTQLEEMEQAFAGKDHETVRRKAHRIKGGAASAGATRLAADAYRLELSEGKNPAELCELIGKLRKHFEDFRVAVDAHKWD
jgi:signal transduction histidine kinase/DNA-binding response OmpR family regulator